MVINSNECRDEMEGWEDSLVVVNNNKHAVD